MIQTLAIGLILLMTGIFVAWATIPLMMRRGMKYANIDEKVEKIINNDMPHMLRREFGNIIANEKHIIRGMAPELLDAFIDYAGKSEKVGAMLQVLSGVAKEAVVEGANEIIDKNLKAMMGVKSGISRQMGKAEEQGFDAVVGNQFGPLGALISQFIPAKAKKKMAGMVMDNPDMIKGLLGGGGGQGGQGSKVS